MKTTLLIMAAGLGSRYGGNKQIDHIGPHGENLRPGSAGYTPQSHEQQHKQDDSLLLHVDQVLLVISR